MTSVPSKARSEFQRRGSPGVDSLKKSLDGRVVDTSFMFQLACAASNSPPLRPTRGSGLGGVGDICAAGDGLSPADVLDVWAQAAMLSRPAASAGTAAHGAPWDRIDDWSDMSGRGGGRNETSREEDWRGRT